MALTCGIIGLPMVGKTTFFNLLTGAGAQTSSFIGGRAAANLATAAVPDARVDWLATLFKPKKTTYAQIQVIDVPGFTPGSGSEFLQNVRDVDVLAYILRTFSNPEVPNGQVDIMGDLDNLQSELLLADLQLVETRLERINNGKKKKMENPLEEEALLKCRSWLEEEKFIKNCELKEEEKEALKHITFLTGKPQLVVVNVDEEQLSGNSFPQQAELEAYCRQNGLVYLTVCGRVEEEIASLPPEERELFMADLGLKESGIARMARAVYATLGLISFLTAGEDEVKAWTIPAGLPAKAAAGKIHSDIERGFIRAETVAFADLERCGTIAEARKQGLFRMEGKEYPVADGDIINFRFNV